jgi:alkylation response protein AidB-like acyl-CoA dehydrogenase
MADFGGDLEAFRAEARVWLEENFPASLKGKISLAFALMEGLEPEGDLALWKQRMAEKGWGTPAWPSEYGGGGLSPQAARVLQQEMNRAGAFNPLTAGMGISMVGPTILEYGTEDQKRRHIPPICRGELRWCLGYSEPGAGSDLAALQTKAVNAGDHWVINGSKIWTSGAQWSDWCGCLVRTDPEAKKHDGISFLLIDMHQPGVETRPIKLIAGASPFCESFFTDARAEKDELLGALNNGWTVGKRLLQHERAGQTGIVATKTEPLQEIAKRYVGVDGEGRLADADLRSRLTSHLMDAKAHELTIARVQAEASGAPNPGAAASVLKNSATLVGQTRAELTLEIMGNRGLGWEGEGFGADEIQAVRGWLSGKAVSIYGGSFEIQNNIISKRILGLPDMTKSS